MASEWVNAHFLNSLVNKLPGGVAIVDKDYRYLCANEALVEINGLTLEQTIGKTIQEVVPEIAEDNCRYVDEVLGTQKEKRNIRVEGKTPKSQKVRVWSVDYKLLAISPNENAVLIAANEITELEQQQERLQHSKYFLRNVLDNLFAFVGVLEVDGTLIDANQAPLKAAGIHYDDVYLKKFWDCYWWSYDEAVQNKVRNAVKLAAQGETSRFDVIIRTGEHSRMPIDFMLAPLRDESGKIINLIPSAIDITARKEMELQLRSRERHFREVVDKTSNGFVIFDKEGRVNYVNLAAQNFIGNSDKREYQNFFRWFESKDTERVRSMVASAQQNVESEHCQVGLISADANALPVEVGISMYGAPADNTFLATISDLSELAKSHHKLQLLLHEKTLLLNEVHHRVKNNLQVISSLLNLQSHYLDEHVAVQFKMCQQRVRSMALVHQLLYEGEDISTVDLSLYVRKLSSLIQDGMGGREFFSQQQISFELPDTPVWLDVKQMVPLGFVITELITNSLKHGKANSGQSWVLVSVLEDESQVVCSVADNGAGVEPDDFYQSAALGNKLVVNFMKQLGASLSIFNDDGAVFQVRLPKATRV